MEYYLRNVCLPVILSCILLRVSGTVTTRNKCCNEGVYVQYYMCADGKNLSISCNEGYLSTFFNDFGDFSRFFIANDSMGEYMDLPSVGCIFREPNYCLGSRSYTSKYGVAVACSSRRIRYNDLTNKPSHQLWVNQFIRTMLTVLNFVSTLTLFVTAFLYYFLREVQDTQGNCAFHLSLNLCLMHAGVCYMMVFDSTGGILPDACITDWYLPMYVGLTAFSWCVIVGHHSWTLAKAGIKTEEDDKLMTRYRYFGYGFPAFIVLLCNIFAHAEKLYTTFEFAVDCYNHQTPVILYCVAVPVFTFSAANYYFFFSAQKQLSDSPALKMRCEQSTLKLMKYRLAINGKLFIITGVSWSMGLIGYALHAIFEYSSFGVALEYYLYFLELLVSSEGIFIFLVLVAFRKRVVSATFRHPFLKDRGIFPAKWKTVIDSETAVESELGGFRELENSEILKSTTEVNT